MKVLELFAGSRSFSKVAEEMGMETFTSDFKDFDKINYVVDFMDFNINKLPFKPDIIWASPPCTSYSIAGIRFHRVNKAPYSEFAFKSDDMMVKLLQMIKEINPKYYFIENPRGVLRKMDFMQNIGIRHTVTYCQYGDKRMKPTDIWTNNKNWKPRKMCKNGMPCHESAPRGSRTGTQGLKGNYERSIEPYELCKEILNSCK